MSSRHVYISIIVASVLGLSLFILFGPGGEKKTKDAYLWDRSWARIEFEPAKVDPNKSEDKKADKKKELKKTPKKGKQTQQPDPHVGKIPLGFTRKAGLFTDKFQVIAPAGGKPGAPQITRVGNNSVKNIFQTWNRPKISSIYGEDELAKQKTSPADLGITKDSARIKLYASEGAEPVIVTVGKKLDNGNVFLRTSLSDHKGMVFGVAAYNVNKMKASYAGFRDRRFVIFPPKTYMGSVEVVYGKPDKDGKRKSIIVEQYEEKNKKGKAVKKWRDPRSGLELPVNVASRINSFAKQLTVRFFADEATVADLGKIDEHWKASKEELILRAKVKGGETFSLVLRKPAAPLKQGKLDLFMIKPENGPGPDYAEYRIYKGLHTQIGAINAALKAAEKRRKRGNIPARPTPLMQPGQNKKPRANNSRIIKPGVKPVPKKSGKGR